MTSLTEQEIIKIHISPNISRSKCNQTIKSGQLIEYNMRNIFFEQSFSKCGGEASPRPFNKKSKLSLSLDQQSGMLQSLFLLYAQVEVYQNILKLRCWPLAFTLNKSILKNKKSLELVSLPHFLYNVSRKICLRLHYIN